ncbi:MAG: sugar ABC transporter ATP-binding protein [Christensenellaceae bacterium]|nr:sugar ABC transporter ATP-binding protein [Christensenellaceae bacterium]
MPISARVFLIDTRVAQQYCHGKGVFMESCLKVVDVYKSFGAVKALNGINLEIRKGEIHCLAGENGCGKSTLIKIISGIYQLDSGHIELAGKQYTQIAPIESIMNGVQVIYQDLSIFPNLPVFENIAFNSELAKKKKLVNRKELRSIAQAAVEKIDFKVDMDALMGDLSVADKQLVAISRALINDAKLIIMDEPTTALTKREVSSLFKTIRDLQQRGISILFVSHKLNEVFEISDRFTILRNGENAYSGTTGELDENKFAYYMTGREFAYETFAPLKLSEKPVLEVSKLSLNNVFQDINFSLYKGEILGITGLLGSGRTELALSLFGAVKEIDGDIRVNGKKVKLRKIRHAIQNGIGYVPEDRLSEGLFLQQSIGENIIISKIDQLTNKVKILNKKLRKAEIEKWVKNLAIATPNPSNAVTTLSGGNQQRVVLAKWLSRNLDVLILNGPTVGVDIASKYDIHQILKKLAAEQMGLIVISDDIPEILRLCNRILIMKDGRLTGEFQQGDVTEKEISDLLLAGI